MISNYDRYLEKVFNKEDLTKFAKMVYVYLCYSANNEGICNTSSTSLVNIIKFTNIKTPLTIIRAIQELENERFITIKRRTDEKGYILSNIYTLLP